MGGWVRRMTSFGNVGVFIWKKVGLRLFSSQTFSRINTPAFLKPSSFFTATCLWRWNRQSVPKCRHMKFRHWGITQQKAYSIQYVAKVWNQEYCLLMSMWLLLYTLFWCRDSVIGSNVNPKGNCGCYRVPSVVISHICLSWFQTFAVYWMLYAFFWVIPRCLKFTDKVFRNVGI